MYKELSSDMLVESEKGRSKVPRTNEDDDDDGLENVWRFRRRSKSIIKRCVYDLSIL